LSDHQTQLPMTPAALSSPPSSPRVGVDEFATLPQPRPPSDSWAATDALGILGRASIHSPKAHGVPNDLPCRGALGNGTTDAHPRDARGSGYGGFRSFLEPAPWARSHLPSQLPSEGSATNSLPASFSQASLHKAHSESALAPSGTSALPTPLAPTAAPSQKCGDRAAASNALGTPTERFPLPWTDHGGLNRPHGGGVTSVDRLPALSGGGSAGACTSPPLVSMCGRRRPLRHSISSERLPLIPEVDASDAGKVRQPPMLPILVRSGKAARAKEGAEAQATDEAAAAPPPKVLPPSLLPPPGLPRPLDGRPGKRVPKRLQPIDDQTAVPREVFSQMMRLGDDVRGSLGAGQHRLRFIGPDGAPVLQRALG